MQLRQLNGNGMTRPVGFFKPIKNIKGSYFIQSHQFLLEVSQGPNLLQSDHLFLLLLLLLEELKKKKKKNRAKTERGFKRRSWHLESVARLE